MSQKSIPVIYTDDRAVNQTSLNTQTAVNNINRSAQNGTILNSVSLSAGANQVPHKLGKNLTGWYMVRQRSAATFYDTQDTGAQKSVFLYLNASAACVVDIYVF